MKPLSEASIIYSMDSVAPILLIGFNRPEMMAAQIDAVRAAKPPRLYIAVDGPRDGREGEAEKCRAVRDCVNLVDWSCEIKTLFRDKNLGCRLGVSGAITWFFENEEAGIVLEDDCRPTIDFIRFASEMLVRYKGDARIGAVCGFNHFNLQSDTAASYHFSFHMDVWGWASWRRVWREYDVDLRQLEGRVEKVIDESAMTPYYKNMFHMWAKEIANGMSTWDIQFSILFLAKKWLSVVPKTRLVANAGLSDEQATHTGGYVYWGKNWSKAGSIEFPLEHPAEVVCDVNADSIRERMEGAIFPRGLTWLGSKFPFLCSSLTPCGHALQRLAPWLFGYIKS